MSTEFLLFLTTVAAISPLLTFAKLWQIKEWRIDRLSEHLRAEGYLRQIFGIIRPAILGLLGLVGLLGLLPRDLWTSSALGALALASAAQIVLRRQPAPVWTQKAITLVGANLALTETLAYALLMTENEPVTAFLPLAQPFLLFATWMLCRPVDHFLKQRILSEAKALRARHPELTVVGITGSVGKTTTKELLAHILGDRHPLATPAYVNTEMGVAQWLIRSLQNAKCKIPSIKYDVLIVEMGAYRKGEISLLCDIVKPTIGIMTFIGTQHIALFGSQKALCEAKSELLLALPKEGCAFLNADSNLCAGLRQAAKCPVTTIGTGGHADLKAFDIEETPQGIRFRVGETLITVPLHGTHNVANVLLAFAAARHLGMQHAAIAAKLRTFIPPERTFQVRSERGVVILDDTHNASPESFKAAIAWARTQPMEQKFLLTSGLIELGEQQDRIHMELGALAAPVFDDMIVLNARAARLLEQGFGKPVLTHTKEIPALEPGSLLVCIGRMPSSTIHRLLPVANEPKNKQQKNE